MLMVLAVPRIGRNVRKIEPDTFPVTAWTPLTVDQQRPGWVGSPGRRHRGSLGLSQEEMSREWKHRCRLGARHWAFPAHYHRVGPSPSRCSERDDRRGVGRTAESGPEPGLGF